MGDVLFLITQQVASGERIMFVVRHQEVKQALALLYTYFSWEQAKIETKLHQMVELLTQVRADGIQSETASLDRWHYASWFILEVLAGGNRRMVVPDRADRHHLYQGQWMTGDQKHR